jgi:ABC-type uncharacterized transport system substrate-binding protein
MTSAPEPERTAFTTLAAPRTGVLLTVEDLPSKQLALAVEMVPNARKVGLLVNPGNPTHEVQRYNVETAAAALGIELVALQARMPDPSLSG